MREECEAFDRAMTALLWAFVAAGVIGAICGLAAWLLTHEGDVAGGVGFATGFGAFFVNSWWHQRREGIR